MSKLSDVIIENIDIFTDYLASNFCPKDIGLKQSENDCENGINCEDCWVKAAKGLEDII